MHENDRESRFMTARDLTQEILSDTSAASSFLERFVDALVIQLSDRSREVGLNAMECLERLYMSKAVFLQGMFSFPCLLNFLDTIINAIGSRLCVPSDRDPAHESMLLRVLKNDMTSVPSPALSIKLITAVVTAIRSSPTPTLFEVLEVLFERSAILPAILPPDTIALVLSSIANRHACNCLSYMLSKLDDDSFETFLSEQSPSIPITPFIHLSLALSRSDQLYRLIPFMDSIVWSRLFESLGTDDPAQLVPAINLVQDLLLLRSPLHDKKISNSSQINLVLPLLKPLLTFGLLSVESSTEFPDDEDFSDYFDDEDTSWEVRRAVVKLGSAVISARDSGSPWRPPPLSDTSKIFRENFEPLFINLLASQETDDLVLAELLTYFIHNSVLDSSYENRLKTRENFLKKKSKCRLLVDELLAKFEAPKPSGDDTSPLVGCPKMTNLESFLSDLSEMTGSISLIDESLVEIVDELRAMIAVDESCIKLVDLGAFKHREDPKAQTRKTALTCVDLIFKKLDKSRAEFFNTTPSKIIESGVKSVLQAITIDMNNLGEELYPIVGSLIRSLAALDGSIIVQALPDILNSLHKIIDTCPVGKRDGLTVNHAGVVLGQLVIVQVDFLRLLARERGISVKSLIERDYPILQDIRTKIAKEVTEGSILRSAHETIGDVI